MPFQHQHLRLYVGILAIGLILLGCQQSTIYKEQPFEIQEV